MPTNETGAGSPLSNDLDESVTYDPNRLLDALMEQLNVKYDAELARLLGMWAPTLSKIRHGHLPIGASTLIRMHEISDLSIGELRALMGDRRKKYRISPVHFKPKANTVRHQE